MDDLLSQLLLEAYAPPALQLDPRGRVLAATGAARRLLESWGVTGEPLGAPVAELLPAGLAHDVAGLARQVRSGRSSQGPVRVCGGVALRAVLRGTGDDGAVVCLERITFPALAGGTAGLQLDQPALIVTRDGGVAGLNAQAERLLELRGLDTARGALMALDAGFVRSEWPRMLRELCRAHAASGELRLARAGGDGTTTLWASLRAVVGPTGRIAFFTAVVPELDTQGSATGELSRRAFSDPLTGLPNLRLFREHVKIALRRAERHQSGLAVMLVDLDRVKSLNDTLGRELGDELLREVAQRLSRELRAADVLARVGGDDFAVVLDDVVTGDDATRVCHKILAALTRPFRLQGHEVFCGASLGVGLYPEAGRSQGALLEAAQAALGEARGLGRNKYVIRGTP